MRHLPALLLALSFSAATDLALASDLPARPAVVARGTKLPKVESDVALDILEQLRPSEARDLLRKGTDDVVPFLAIHFRGKGAEEIEALRPLADRGGSTARRLMLLAAAIPSPELGTLAVELLPSSEGALRAAVLDAIEATAPASAEPPLLELLDELDDPGQIARLLRPLAAVASESSAGRLTELVQDESPSVRRLAAKALARTGTRSAVATLEKQLEKERDAACRREILCTLAVLGGADALADLKLCLSAPKKRVERAQCLDAVALAPGIDAVKCLVGILESPRSDLRREAAMALGTRREELAATALLSAIEREEDPNAFRFIATSLGKLHEKRAARHLAAMLEEPNVSLFAALALAQLDDASGNKVLRTALGYPEYRLLAAEALALIGDRGALDQLAKAYARERTADARARMLVAIASLTR